MITDNDFQSRTQNSGIFFAVQNSFNATALVVDDDPGIQLLLRRMAERARLKVLTASDGVEALEIFKRQPVELVLTDINMPRMDGLQLLGHIKTIQPATFVVLVTANQHQIENYHQADLVLGKPFRLQDFEAVLQTFFQTRTS